MADEQAPQNGQESQGGAPQAGNDQNGQGQAPETFSRAYVEQLRQEAAQHRTRAKELEAAEEQRKQADMTEAQKEKARADKYEARVAEFERKERDGKFRDTVTAAAEKAGALYPTQLHKFLSDLARDDDGTPQGLADAIKSLQKEMPALFAANNGRGSADAGQGREGIGGGGGMNDFIRGAVRR